jgi:hypothetical protein
MSELCLVNIGTGCDRGGPMTQCFLLIWNNTDSQGLSLDFYWENITGTFNNTKYILQWCLKSFALEVSCRWNRIVMQQCLHFANFDHVFIFSSSFFFTVSCCFFLFYLSIYFLNSFLFFNDDLKKKYDHKLNDVLKKEMLLICKMKTVA